MVRLAVKRRGKQMAQNTPADQVQAWVTAAKNKDANSIAALYTTNAVLCATEGIIKGQDDIRNDFETQFGAPLNWTLTNITDEVDNVVVEPPKPNAWGWSYGAWSGTVNNPNPPPSGPVPVQGSWSLVWIWDSQKALWMIQQQTIVTNL
jgi:hypothetical protein